MEKKVYPLLENNSELVEAIKAVESNQKRIVEITKQIQDSCEHVFADNFITDPGYIWDYYEGWDKKVLESRTCKECGFEVKRPKGAPWDICHKCWSPMKEDGVIPGQGERTFIYKCTNKKCNHIVRHT